MVLCPTSDPVASELPPVTGLLVHTGCSVAKAILGCINQGGMICIAYTEEANSSLIWEKERKTTIG